MILVVACGLAVAWGMVRGGRLLGFAGLPLRRGWIVIAALGLQLYPTYFREAQGEGLDGARVLILIGSYLLLLVFIWENRTLPGIWLVGAGLIANLGVMLLNGGYMPTTREALVQAGYAKYATAELGSHLFASKDVILSRADIHGWILSDLFVIPRPFPLPSVFSFGDALIAVGLFLIIQHAMRKPSVVSIPWRS